MPGRVLSLQVKKGERVSGGQVAVILEAMKMENEIQIENEGVVTQIFVEENDTVDTGDPLLECEENPRNFS
jgi:pyruvate carboxylase subunit B